MIHLGPTAQCQEALLRRQQNLERHRNVVSYRMKKLASRQLEIKKSSDALKEKLRQKYQEMRRVLDEDLRLTLGQLDAEQEAAEREVEERMEACCLLREELDQELENTNAPEKETGEMAVQSAEIEERISEALKSTDPDSIQTDDFRNQQLLSLTGNLLLFIRSQLPVSKRLLQSYAADVILDPDTAHPKLTVSPEGDAVAYTTTWKDFPETPARFDTTLNVVSRDGFTEGRRYWEVEVSGKTYWEIGLTYPSIPRRGREEDCWLGRGKESWCVEYFSGDYTAWHSGVPHVLPLVEGRQFKRIGVYCSFPGGLVSFLGADTMTPLHCFCAGAFSDALHQALCPGHDNQGSNWKPLRICDASRSAPGGS